MQDYKTLKYIKEILKNMPTDWLTLTTHRLDIYDEKQAKSQFVTQFEHLYQTDNASQEALYEIPTAYDYIRLGHPLSCVLEWTIANLHAIKSENVISFSSKTMPILAILRKNTMKAVPTQILYTDALPKSFDIKILRDVYGYQFELKKIKIGTELPNFVGSRLLISQAGQIGAFDLSSGIDFFINFHDDLGSILLINNTKSEHYISDIQHVRRRETIAMTPAHSLKALQILTATQADIVANNSIEENTSSVIQSILDITGGTAPALVGSSGLSIQYAIMMGLIDHALVTHPEKEIKIIVPPNCYGGTNDQARRVAAAIKNVSIVDLPVDEGNDMVQSIDSILHTIANEDAVPYIIAEIPTNPRVEVPELLQLKAVLNTARFTSSGATAIPPVFILDQTFCPNVHFLGAGEILSEIPAISYASGSKFPSGGKCTAGYCIGNEKAGLLMEKIAIHLKLLDNEATPLQMELLAAQLPSMNQRIFDAYKNTRSFVDFIQNALPSAKINFVSEELASSGFTPSVFSLDLPTKGNTEEEKENYKRALNYKLINLMIAEIPNESKFCVSYGQLKGLYWTIPATSTQGTTKEGDKDYIVRASLSPNLDLEHHKKVFLKFVQEI
jgi:cystathionine beta-lyase/cystathionine gamma-synthase